MPLLQGFVYSVLTKLNVHVDWMAWNFASRAHSASLALRMVLPIRIHTHLGLMVS